jgi:phosphatidylserine/phosphatidylglycerophosphate/cardiolipin synthase-like enzyme
VAFAPGGPKLQPTGSDKSPIRRYAWADHTNKAGDKVAYQVVPVIAAGSGAGAPDETRKSPISNAVTISGVVDKNFEAYFNRGIVLSQFMANFLKGDESPAALKKFKNDLNADPDGESKIRSFLGGPLRERLVDLLKTANSKGQHVFAALFELSDNLLIEELKAIGKRAHVVLSNGAHKSAGDDENADARKTLKGCDMHDRMLPSGHLGHNKFAVFTDAHQKPVAVWTGSTNWSPTGLCTQMNNGILINDPAVAGIFLNHWNLLKAAGPKATTPELLADNDKVKTAAVNKSPVNVWFTTTKNAPEMQAVVDLVNKAQEGVLFLMFQPGGSPIENAILKIKDEKPNLFVKGVISTMDSKDETKGSVELVRRGDINVPPLEVVQPAGIGNDVTGWATEVSRQSFLHNIGFAIVHSKVIVIDPNGKNPVVVTGSHNFSASASGKNDENLIIIQGNAALAQAYAVDIQSLYDHYEFRAVAKLMHDQGKNVSDVMKDPKSWQAAWFKGDKQLELDFWLGKTATFSHAVAS